MLLGNTGALYHEGGALSPSLLGTVAAEQGELPALPEGLRQAMGQSLRAGRPVAVEGAER
jgi:hypothetical protein